MKRKYVNLLHAKYSRRAVSDVVGNIILLAVTVMMFSGILIYSMNLPKPEVQSHIRFSASLTLTETGYANITVTHTGGDNIKVADVRIAIYIDGNIESIRLSASPGWGNVEHWKTGVSWKYTTTTPVSISSTVNVLVINDITNKVIFSSALLGGSTNLPPMVLKIFSTPDPILIGKNYQFFAIVWDPDGNLDINSIYINVTNLYNDGVTRVIKMNRVKDDLYATNATNLATSLSLPFDKSLKGEKSVKVNATDRLGLASNVTCSVIVGEESELIGVADPSIGVNDIAFSNPSPTQGDYVTIYAKVTNNGTMGTNVTVKFTYEINGIIEVIGNGTDQYGNNTQYIRGNFDIKIFQIAWRPLSSGIHNISAEVFVNTSMVGSALDINLTNNVGTKSIGIIPRILIVDDDQHAGDGSNRDTVGFMKAALTAAGFEWEYTTVRLNMDGPLLSSGDHKLEDYGIVIWMCGYQSTGTLTPTDRQTLQDYLSRRDSSLWLIGQDIINDLASTGGTTFIQNVLHVSAYTLDYGTPNKINGTPGHFISNGLSYNSRKFFDPEDKADIITPDANAKGFLQNSSKTNPNNCSLTYEDNTRNTKLCFFAFEFSRLQRLDEMAQLAYKIILWLGNLQTRYGNDLAISEQNMSNQYPFYAEVIQINATVRNNGDEDIPNSNIPYIRVQFILDDTEVIGEILITDVLQKGGVETSSKTVNISWKADRLGHHTIVAVVDPLMEIEEVNEDNNRVSAEYTRELAMIDVY
ncbi:MAG: CARDB domain-containing protein, partial [Thermoplasmata archaeon]